MSFGTMAQGIAVMQAALSTPGLSATGITYDVYVGDEGIPENASPPRIIIILVSAEPTTGVKQNGGTPRTLATEWINCVAILWAQDLTDPTGQSDYAAVGYMRAVFLSAMRKVFSSGSFKQMGGEFTSTEGQSVDEAGRKFIQRFAFMASINDVGDTTTTVSTIDINAGINTGVDIVIPP